MTEMPKSYLSAEEREGLTQRQLCLYESIAAVQSGDVETGWEWLKHTRPAASSLRLLKKLAGEEFIREKGFDTSAADAAYGKDWLAA
jgi:hypothetical protein